MVRWIMDAMQLIQCINNISLLEVKCQPKPSFPVIFSHVDDFHPVMTYFKENFDNFGLIKSTSNFPVLAPYQSQTFPISPSANENVTRNILWAALISFKLLSNAKQYRTASVVKVCLSNVRKRLFFFSFLRNETVYLLIHEVWPTLPFSKYTPHNKITD